MLQYEQCWIYLKNYTAILIKTLVQPKTYAYAELQARVLLVTCEKALRIKNNFPKTPSYAFYLQKI